MNAGGILYGYVPGAADVDIPLTCDDDAPRPGKKARIMLLFPIYHTRWFCGYEGINRNMQRGKGRSHRKNREQSA